MNIIEIIQNQFAISQNGLSVSWPVISVIFISIFLWNKIFTKKVKN